MRLVVDVQRAYTGSDGTCTIAIDNGFLPSASFGTIDCKTTGLRVFTGNANGEGKKTNDVINALPHVFVETLQFNVSNGSGTNLVTTDEIQTPIISVFVEASPVQ